MKYKNETMLKSMVTIFGAGLFCCTTLCNGAEIDSVDPSRGSNEITYEIVQMRIHVGDKIFLGVDPRSMNNFHPEIDSEKIELRVGQKFPLRVELLLSNGEIKDVTRDEKTIYYASRFLLKVVDKEYIVGEKLSKGYMAKLKEGMLISGHLSVYYNIVDWKGQLLKKPTGPVAGGIVFFSILGHE